MGFLNASCVLLQEKDARDIEIPNIRWEVFELMMRFVELANFYIKLSPHILHFYFYITSFFDGVDSYILGLLLSH